MKGGVWCKSINALLTRGCVAQYFCEYFPESRSYLNISDIVSGENMWESKILIRINMLMPVQQTASTHVRSSYCSIVSKRCSTSKRYCTEGDSNSMPSMAADSVPLDYLYSVLCGGVLHITLYKPSPLEKQDLGFVLQNPNLFMQMHMTTAESSVRLSCCNFVGVRPNGSLTH